jgi:hypothetical protein
VQTPPGSFADPPLVSANGSRQSRWMPEMPFDVATLTPNLEAFNSVITLLEPPHRTSFGIYGIDENQLYGAMNTSADGP